jgi:hypothetical protein
MLLLCYLTFAPRSPAFLDSDIFSADGSDQQDDVLPRPIGSTPDGGVAAGRHSTRGNV